MERWVRGGAGGGVDEGDRADERRGGVGWDGMRRGGEAK